MAAGVRSHAGEIRMNYGALRTGHRPIEAAPGLQAHSGQGI